MNYAADPIWQHLHQPAVRTLAALLTAPPLWQSGCELPVAELLGDRGFRLLEQWDTSSAPLPLPAPGQRLGKYAETLLAHWFAHAPHSRLIAADHPVRQPENGCSAGALDFVVELSGSLYHLELCCKYYGADSGLPEHMSGFDRSDTLVGKAERLTRQLALSDSRHGRAALAGLGIPADTVCRASIVRGIGFSLSGSLPEHPHYPPNVWSGRLLHDWSQYPADGGTADTRFYVLPRHAYPAPARADFADTLDFDAVSAAVTNGLVAQMRPAANGSWQESGRLMVRCPSTV